jgi:hypothetical protein
MNGMGYHKVEVLVDVDHILTIKVMFPDAQFVHIVRDGRNVACSYKKLKEKQIDSPYAPCLPHRIEDIAREWQRNIETISRSFNAIGRQEQVHELTFEALLLDPEGQLTKLCELLGEEYEPSMLEYDRLNKEHQLEPSEFLQWKQNTLRPPIQAQVDRYKRQLTKQEINVFEQIAGDALRKHGFLN